MESQHILTFVTIKVTEMGSSCKMEVEGFRRVRKKLLAKSKLRGAEDLGPWIKAICNHLWWCSSNSCGNKEWLEESFISIVHHVVNEHTFEG